MGVVVVWVLVARVDVAPGDDGVYVTCETSVPECCGVTMAVEAKTTAVHWRDVDVGGCATTDEGAIGKGAMAG